MTKFILEARVLTQNISKMFDSEGGVAQVPITLSPNILKKIKDMEKAVKESGAFVIIDYDDSPEWKSLTISGEPFRNFEMSQMIVTQDGLIQWKCFMTDEESTVVMTTTKKISDIGVVKVSGSYYEQIAELVKQHLKVENAENVRDFKLFDAPFLKEYQGDFLWACRDENNPGTDILLLNRATFTKDWVSDMMIMANLEETLFQNLMWKCHDLALLTRSSNKFFYYGSKGIVLPTTRKELTTRIGHFFHELFEAEDIRTEAVIKRLKVRKEDK